MSERRKDRRKLKSQDFVFSPDKVGDITVDLSVTPEGADAVTSKSITLTMDAPTIESVTINPVTDIDNGVDAGTDKVPTINGSYSSGNMWK